MSLKEVVARGMREAGAALKHANGMEVSIRCVRCVIRRDDNHLALVSTPLSCYDSNAWLFDSRT
jgi:hypothetical protein